MNATCPGSTELRARFCSTRHAAQSSPHENKELTARILRREVASSGLHTAYSGIQLHANPLRVFLMWADCTDHGLAISKSISQTLDFVVLYLFKALHDFGIELRSAKT